MPVRVSGQQIHFLSLQTAIFCVQCELISANNTSCCLACGSNAVLSLSRLFGGSLRAQPTARLIEDDELNRLVRELLREVPSPESEFQRCSLSARLPARHHARTSSSTSAADSQFVVPQIDLEPAIGVITERAQALTGATGAAGLLLTLAFGSRPSPAYRLNACVKGKLCSATMRKATLKWTWYAAGVWESVLSWRRRFASFKKLWEYSKCFPQRRTHLTTRMSPLCSFFPA